MTEAICFSSGIKVPCPQPRAVAGATMTWTITTYGDIAEYICKPGYRFVDRQRTTSSICVDGVWSAAVPDCIRTYRISDQHFTFVT